MTDEHTIRPATPADADAIHHVHGRAVWELTGDSYSESQLVAWTAPLSPEGYRWAMRQGEDFFVAVSGDRIVGFASLLAAEVRALYVAPDRAGRGIGSALLARVESRARREGISRLEVHASLNAVGFYRRFGYVGDERRELELPGGERLPSLLLTKKLD